MSQHELILLSPYRLPTHHSLYLADEDVAAFLNGLAALWHPAALRGAAGPPRVASPYEHEQPHPNCVYATPDHPPLLLPDDWNARVQAAGAVAFKSHNGRDATLGNLKDCAPLPPNGWRRRPAPRPRSRPRGAVPWDRLRPRHDGSALRGDVA